MNVRRVLQTAAFVGGALMLALVLFLSIVSEVNRRDRETTVEPTASPQLAQASPTPAPTPRWLVPPYCTGETCLKVCAGQEPDTLYIYGYGNAMTVAGHVQSAIYDDPIDQRSFAYQAVILEKIPSLADGDAVIRRVQVEAGDVVVRSEKQFPRWWRWEEPIVLPEEVNALVRLRPAGCYADDCAVLWDGRGLEMEQLAVTFTLKSGITWADGVPVTAADSVYSFQLCTDPHSPTYSGHPCKRTASYVAVDEQTVVWTGVPGYYDVAYMTNFWTPLPEHQLSQMSAAEMVDSEPASRHPLGYGPYAVKEWVRGSYIAVVRNPHYFRAEEGLPHFDTVIFHFIGEDPEVALQALQAGACDILTQDLELEEVAEQLLALEAAGEVKPLFVPGTAWEHLDFGILPHEEYKRPDFFADVRMRRAIAMCLDRQQAVDELFYGRSVVAHSYVSPAHPLYDAESRQIPYDPERAMALLEEMGWHDADGDGVREAHGVERIPEGTRLAFEWTSTTAPLRVAYMQIFQEHLQACGFDIALDNLTLDMMGVVNPVSTRHFDLASFTWLTEVEPPCYLYLCAEIPTENDGWSGMNDVGYCSAAYDAACEAALQAMPGMPAYERYHKEAQRVFAEELPSLPLYLRPRIAACRPEIEGLIMDPTVGSEMWNIEEFARR